MRKLSSFKKEDLEEYTFPGTHAAVMDINEKIPQSDVEEAWEEYEGQLRIYPSEKGWKVKLPYWDVMRMQEEEGCDDLPEGFYREDGGWDHEHCSFCNEHIHRGELGYTHDHEAGGVYVLCQSCADKVIK